jgi:tRNA threonylcarbamoyladenosine biosynthesis protein TsaE
MESVGAIDSASPEQTHQIGICLGRLLEPGHVVGLVGELGAGKTCLTTGAAEGLGVAPEVYVSSPTFTLINEYPGRIPLIHIDFYRLSDPTDLIEIGVDEYYRTAEGACLVEWFDKFPQEAPPGYLEVVMKITGLTTRTLQLRACRERHQALGCRWVEATQEINSR